MKTPQLSFSRIVRESGTTLVVTMGLYLVPGCTVALLSTANYRQVMGPRRKPCGTILAHGTMSGFFKNPDGSAVEIGDLIPSLLHGSPAIHGQLPAEGSHSQSVYLGIFVS